MLQNLRGGAAALALSCVTGLALVPFPAAAAPAAVTVDPADEDFFLSEGQLPQSPRYGTWEGDSVNTDLESETGVRICDEKGIFNDPVLDDATVGFRPFEAFRKDRNGDFEVEAAAGQYVTEAPSAKAAAQFLRNAQRRHLQVCGKAKGPVYRDDAKNDPNFKFELVRYPNLEVADGVRLFGIYVTFTRCCEKRGPIGHSTDLLALGRDGSVVTAILISTGDTKPNAPVKKFRKTAKAAMAKLAD